MADPNDLHWKTFGALFQKAARDAFAGLPQDLALKTRHVFIPLREGQPVVTFPDTEPINVVVAPVHERVREVATTADARARTLSIQNAATAAVTHAVTEGTFVGDGRMLGDHVVVPVLDVNRAAYARCPALGLVQVGNMTVPRGLADTLADVVLEEATSELSKPKPGSDLHDCMKLEGRATRLRAARRLLDRVAVSISAPHLMGRLFDDLSTIASLRYESQANRGALVLGRLNHPAVKRTLSFAEQVPLGRPSWARKIVQLATPAMSVLCCEVGLYGLGRIDGYDRRTEDLFEAVFVDHHRWQLVHAGEVLLDVHYGVPNLPSPRLNKDAFVGEVGRTFGGEADGEKLWSLALAAVERAHHGALLVISENAAEEAARLKGQSTMVERIAGTPDLIGALSAIDGAILMDPRGSIHAFGVILDGKASSRGTAARGARYNSSIRYVDSAQEKVLALVVSEDGNVNPISRS